jgi:prepilin-type N-terminal cleavage/methylation domain-containing protein
MKNGESGFTLLEIVVGSAIMAVVVGAIATTLTILFLNYGQAAGQNSALPQVQNIEEYHCHSPKQFPAVSNNTD